MRIFIGAVVALVLAGVAGGLVYVNLAGSKQLRYTTQAKLLAAMPATATAELQSRGVSLESPLSCADMPGWTEKSMRVMCTSTTPAGQPIQIIGAGERKAQEQYFTILVGGRAVIQNAGCLGADCREKND